MKYALLAHVRARARICAKATSCNCMFLRIRLFACLPTCYHSIPSHAHNTHTPARSCIRKVQRPPASTHAVQVEQCSWLTANYSNDATSKCIVLFSRMAGNLPVCAPFAGCTTRGLRILPNWHEQVAVPPRIVLWLHLQKCVCMLWCVLCIFMRFASPFEGNCCWHLRCTRNEGLHTCARQCIRVHASYRAYR
jgi:hypothetical protein